jgi:beta-phosphoglucomutase-like phosphatase (HAD superfamily)
VVEDILEELSLQLAFDVTTTGEEVLSPKPDPEIYLLTAQKLGLEPKECIVIEDAVGGVRAGVEAGMQVLAFESEYAPKKQLLAAGAKWVVENFEEVGKLIEAI